MPGYRYLALDADGKKHRGAVTAPDENRAELYLGRSGLTVVRLREETTRRFALKISRKVSLTDLAGLYDRLSDTLQVGLPLIASLSENAKLVKNTVLSRTIEHVRTLIEEGKLFSEAMGQHPRVFDRFQVAVIHMGEISGTLPGALRQLSDLLTWRVEQRSQLKRGLIYPIFIMGALTVVTAVWVGYVLPKVASFLKSMDITLPAITRIVIRISTIFAAYWPLFAAFPVVSILLIAAWSKTARGRFALDRFLLRLPYIGKILRNAVVSRLSLNFSMMFEAGITIGSIFEILSGGALGNRFIEQDLRLVHQRVLSGQSLYESFSSSREYPDLFLGGIRSGEMAGKLGETFRKTGVYYDKEVNRSIKAFAATLEPAAIVIMGGVFGIIILAILLPIYDIISKIKG